MAPKARTLSISELDLARLRRFCVSRSDDSVQTQAEFRGRTITIVRYYRPWPGARPDQWVRAPFAQCRYTAAHGSWLLYFTEAGRWYLYCMDATPHLDALIMEIDVDPMGYFVQ